MKHSTDSKKYLDINNKPIVGERMYLYTSPKKVKYVVLTVQRPSNVSRGWYALYLYQTGNIAFTPQTSKDLRSLTKREVKQQLLRIDKDIEERKKESKDPLLPLSYQILKNSLENL